MINYVANNTVKHVIPERDARKAFAPIREFLERCTTCRGAAVVDDEHHDRAPVPFDDVAARIDALVASPFLGDIRLMFLFHLCEPDTHVPFPTTGVATERMLWRSNLHAVLRHGRISELELVLTWPFDDVTDGFLRSFDATFETLGLAPRPGVMDRDGEPFPFDRGARDPLPDDPLGRTLHQAVLADLGDVGARIAYADWLTTHGDPLGEALVLQVEIAAAAHDRFRKQDLERRLRELVRRHGLRWSRVLVPR